MIRVAISLQRIVVSALILTSIVGVLNLTPSQPAYAAAYTIAPGGGDCNTIGVWDAKRLKCTLKFDIIGNIEITGDGITLDGAQHTLTGDGTGTGVLLVGRTGVTVKNVIVENFHTGIFLDESDGNTLTRNTANSNVVGIRIDSNSNTLTGNTANSNDIVGIGLTNGATGNTLTGNTANSNDFNGIGLDEGSNSNTLTSNTANSNDVNGIVIFTDNNILQKNTASFNLFNGFRLSFDINTTLKGNTANSNGAFGYDSNTSTGLLFSKNKCSGNGSGGSDPTGLCLPQP